jgi:hypothetical protein
VGSLGKAQVEKVGEDLGAGHKSPLDELVRYPRQARCGRIRCPSEAASDFVDGDRVPDAGGDRVGVIRLGRVNMDGGGWKEPLPESGRHVSMVGGCAAREPDGGDEGCGPSFAPLGDSPQASLIKIVGGLGKH